MKIRSTSWGFKLNVPDIKLESLQNFWNRKESILTSEREISADGLVSTPVISSVQHFRAKFTTTKKLGEKLPLLFCPGSISWETLKLMNRFLSCSTSGAEFDVDTVLSACVVIPRLRSCIDDSTLLLPPPLAIGERSRGDSDTVPPPTPLPPVVFGLCKTTSWYIARRAATGESSDIGLVYQHQE